MQLEIKDVLHRHALALFVLVLVFVGGTLTGRYLLPYVDPVLLEKAAECTVDGEHTITRVLDGDTVAIQLCGIEEKLRLIGMNAPELHNTRTGVQCLGKEAAEEAARLLLNQKVIVETDETQGNGQTHRDMHGRLLVYVFLEDDVTWMQRLILKAKRWWRLETSNNFGERMLAEGFAHEELYQKHYSYEPEFKAAEASAKAARRGIWADPACAEVSEKTTVRTH